MNCDLCPHGCSLPEGGSGLCKTRFNRGGLLELPFRSFVTALAEDPVEKKPLYHFRPGTAILSAGFAGCNLRCPFCQNWHISQSTDVPGRRMEPGDLAETAGKTGAIAYTYSEPLVHFEFLLDCMKEARKRGIANVLVTNGCINTKPAAEILALTDAANIDLKCFSEETYKDILGGDLKTVLSFIKTAFETGVHIEITTLAVPGLNESDAEMDKCRDFIAGLDSAIPWHLSAYHPDWKWKQAATSPEILMRCAARARKRLPYVYTGNISGENNTHCPHCGKAIIRRMGYSTDAGGMLLEESGGKKQYFCAFCKKPVPVRW